MKLKLSLLVMMSLFAMPSFAQEKNGNGGDICEDRILEIRDNVKAWIEAGNYVHLSFEKNESPADYRENMLDAIRTAVVSCTDKPVYVGRAEKDCVNNGERPFQITCNTQRFNALDETKQYRLVHHEYAGLAEFEENDKPNREESDYHLSDQITAQLENVVVKRLPIIPIAKLYIDFIHQKNGQRKLALECETKECKAFVLALMTREKNGTYSKTTLAGRYAPGGVENIGRSIQRLSKVRVLPRINFGTEWANCLNCDNYHGWLFNFTRGLWSLVNENDLGDARIPAIIGASALTFVSGPLDVATTIAVDSTSVVTWPFRRAAAFLTGRDKRVRRTTRALQVFTSPTEQNATVSKKDFDLILRGIRGY